MPSARFTKAQNSRGSAQWAVGRPKCQKGFRSSRVRPSQSATLLSLVHLSTADNAVASSHHRTILEHFPPQRICAVSAFIITSKKKRNFESCSSGSLANFLYFCPFLSSHRFDITDTFKMPPAVELQIEKTDLGEVRMRRQAAGH